MQSAAPRGLPALRSLAVGNRGRSGVAVPVFQGFLEFMEFLETINVFNFLKNCAGRLQLNPNRIETKN